MPKQKAKRKKRSGLEIRLDNYGLQFIVDTYIELRESFSEKKAEMEAVGAGTDCSRLTWRKYGRQGKEPYRKVFAAIREAELKIIKGRVPELFSEIRARDPHKAYALLHPRLKYGAEDAARAMMLSAAHAKLMQQFIDGLEEHLQASLTEEVFDVVMAEIYVFTDGYEADVTDADVIAEEEEEDES